MTEKTVVAAFDFDVTITMKDTFVPFLYWVFGRKTVYKTFIKLLPEAIKVACKLSDRDKFKEKIIAALFTNQPIKPLKVMGAGYASSFTPLIRLKARERIKWHKEQGHRLIMVSASLNLYLEKAAKDLGFDDLLCTELEEHEELFTGHLNGKNCRCQGKVNKLQELLGDLSQYELYAYGDSDGDKQMLAIANHPNLRAFE